jgi:amidase
MTDTSLCFESATTLAGFVSRREISCVELLEAHLAHIDQQNSKVNAIVTLVPDHAHKLAIDLDHRLARGEAIGPLAGLPVAHKDLFDTAGIRTTYGSPMFEHHVPEKNAIIVDRLLAAGAVTIGKTNTPEWGAGSQTFNKIFGPTRNPYDLSRTCGGSSGGAATALAMRLIPIADGSDTGGSLRNPANFCNVVGMRTSPGRVPRRAELGWFSLGVEGPMARNVADCALMLQAIAGPHPESPISIAEPASRFEASMERDFKGVRVAFSEDFSGQLPVDPRVRKVVRQVLPHLDAIGCEVEDGCPVFGPADFVFKTLRAWSMAAKHGERIRMQREQYKETIIWNVEQGLSLTGEDLARAEKERTWLFQQVREFMDIHEFLILPVSQVPPFDLETEWVQEVDGVKMETYIDWMKSCSFISPIGLPAMSLPLGFTDDGVPVGIQIVGRQNADFEVLQMAYAIEQQTRTADRLPPIISDIAPP